MHTYDLSGLLRNSDRIVLPNTCYPPLSQHTGLQCAVYMFALYNGPGDSQ